MAASASEQTFIQFMLAWTDSAEAPDSLFAQFFVEHLREEWMKNLAQSCAAYRVSRELIRKHGTTLLSILIFRGRVFMAQLGDGEICLINKNGETSFVVEPEDGPVSTATQSLCSDSQDGQWRFACTAVENLSFLMLSSDGLINSMESNAEYVKLAQTLQGYLQRFPVGKIKEALPKWLEDYSRRGSSDDISLVAINMNQNEETQEETGEHDENEHRNSGTQNHQQTRRGSTGRSLPCAEGRKGIRIKAVQRCVCYYRPKKPLSGIWSIPGLPVQPTAADRFAWPLELVEVPNSNRFGYLMPLIDMSRYIPLADIGSGRIAHPGFAIMAEAGRQLAEAFRMMHIKGYCCRDISENNFLFSPKTGDVVICDNDNVAVDKHNIGKIWGTPQFMAPEVSRGEVRPSTVSDQHSLAVVLFLLLCGGHPLHGEREFNIRIYDGAAALELYGNNPVFVFDPHNAGNRLPNEPGYRHVAKHWKILPTEIRQMFVRAFTTGLKTPSTRVTDIEWQNALSRMQGLQHVCSCGAENFWDPHRKEQQLCWNKGCSVAFPGKLFIKGKKVSVLLAKPGQVLTSLHFGEKSSASIVGEMEPHPTDSSLVLLRNKTGETWNAQLGSQQAQIPEERAIPLYPGLSINVLQHDLTVYP